MKKRKEKKNKLVERIKSLEKLQTNLSLKRQLVFPPFYAPTIFLLDPFTDSLEFGVWALAQCVSSEFGEELETT